jgi:glycosyltransferase involved in cell wall biosynthesis
MNKILFLMGSANISGGTYVIFQHALYLQRIGLNVTIACMNFDEYKLLKRRKKHWHEGINKLKFIPIKNVANTHYDLAIFTWWRTIYSLPQITARLCLYFVQSIESKFYTNLDAPLIKLVNDTYTFGLPVITEATWIKDYLHSRYGTKPLLAHNGIRKDIYGIDKLNAYHPTRKKLRVLVEGPLNVWFKNTEKTISLCSNIKDIELWLLTSTKISKYPKVDRVFSQLSKYDVPNVYSACDVLVKLSYVEGMFGPPLEMFHCDGTCIVYDVSGHDEYIQHGYNGLVVKTDDEDTVIKSIELLRDNPAYLKKLKYGARKTADRWIDWEKSSQKFNGCMNEIYKKFPSKKYNSKNFYAPVTKALTQYESFFSTAPFHNRLTNYTKKILNIFLKKNPALKQHLKKIYFNLKIKVRTRHA